jgi:hypothetical protein
MPRDAWKSLHGGSRKWFPEQSADRSLEKRGSRDRKTRGRIVATK